LWGTLAVVMRTFSDLDFASLSAVLKIVRDFQSPGRSNSCDVTIYPAPPLTGRIRKSFRSDRMMAVPSSRLP